MLQPRPLNQEEHGDTSNRDAGPHNGPDVGVLDSDQGEVDPQEGSHEGSGQKVLEGFGVLTEPAKGRAGLPHVDGEGPQQAPRAAARRYR